MIAKLFNWIVGTFCAHKWEIIDKAKWEIIGGGYGPMYTLRCEKCGEIKVKLIRVNGWI
jgi:hypothetical protein